MKEIRAFIAIDLPDEVKRTVSTISAQLSAVIPDDVVRWAQPGTLHLTIRFLGQTDEQALPAIGRSLDKFLSFQPAFPLKIGRLAAFPNPNRPRVIILNIHGTEPGTMLDELRSAIDAALGAVGIVPDAKPFNPHLTLGRVRNGRYLDPLPHSIELPDTTFSVRDVHLIESDLGPGGPHYTTRHSVRLAGLS